MSIEKITGQIIDGPSRDTLFDSMKYNYEDESKVIVYFDISTDLPQEAESNEPNSLAVRDFEIHMLKHKDGTGYNFVIEGFVDIKERDEGNIFYVPRSFKAIYSAKTRKGNIEIARVW